MNRMSLRALIAVGTAATVAACAAPAQDAQTIGIPGRGIDASSLDRSWMNPAATSVNLLYVTYSDADIVNVYSYPAGTRVGQLTNFPADPLGACSDRKGNVWITMRGWIYEYAHGGSRPIKELDNGGFYAGACSVDPSTGDVAVTNYHSGLSRRGNLSIYPGGSGPRKVYRSPLFLAFISCGYDPSGNLYVTGEGKHTPYLWLFAELPKGAGALKTVTLSHTPKGQPDVQWDGQNVAVSSPQEQMIIRFKISRSLGKEVGFTSLYNFQWGAAICISKSCGAAWEDCRPGYRR